MKSLDIKKRFDALVSQRKTLDSTLQIIEQYVVPHRGEFFKPLTDEHEVDWRRREIYDSTAIDANETLSSSLQGSLTSPSTKWFSMGFRSDELTEDQEAQEWVEKCANIVHDALQDSNFDLESAEFYLDLTSYGTAIIFEEAESEDPNNWKGIDFQAAPMLDCYFEMNHKNQVLRFYRQYKWTALQICDKFGKDTPELVTRVLNQEGSNNVRFTVIFCVFERPDKKGNIDSTSILSKSERPFGWKWTLHQDGSQIGDEGGYYEQPAFVARWRKTAGSQWGYSPAHIILSDILTLNELTEETLEALGKVVDPPTLTTQRNLLTDLDIGRGGLTVVQDLDGIKAYESRARFDVGELRIDRLQQAIRSAYRVDQLQMKDSPAMTATEVNVRYELMQRLLGPTLGRLKSDYLDPLISRTFKILYRAGQLPEIPQSVKEVGAELDVQYIGPLPRAQRQEIVQSANSWVANTVAIAEAKPEVLDIPNFDMIMRDTGTLSGLPAKYINSKETVGKIRKDRAEQEAQMAKSAAMKEEGEAMQAQGAGEMAMNEAMGGAGNAQ